MTAREFEARILKWARDQPNVDALIQIGSRAQSAADVDEWSDWDFHLIVQDVSGYRDDRWLRAIAQVWNCSIEKTERGVTKVSVVFEGGWEVDFVPLTAWQMKLVYQAMAYPKAKFVFPKLLVNGIYNTRLVVGPGYKVLVGGVTWEKRLTALATNWPRRPQTADDYRMNLANFWRHAVWIHKKIMRGELRAALRWMHVELTERRLFLLEQEALLLGRPARPEARKAERWLDARRLEQTAITTSPDQKVLANALLQEIALFEEVSRSVATSRGFDLPDHGAVADWIRSELHQLLAKP